MPAPKETQQLVDEIFNRIEDLSTGDEDRIAVVLSLVILKLLNNKYPLELSTTSKRLIKENYPEATLQDMKDRGLSEEGLLAAVVVFNKAEQIAIDYSPITNVRSDQNKDFANESSMATSKEVSIKAYSDILNEGFSPFGAAASLITNSVIQAISNGVELAKIIRLLSEAVSISLKYGRPTSSARRSEDEILNALCMQMGISKATAKKYLKMFKDQ